VGPFTEALQRYRSKEESFQPNWVNPGSKKSDDSIEASKSMIPEEN
jgi:hypothetical protein